MTIFAIQSPRKDNPTFVPKIFESLKGGEGRFGWSYVPSADMRKLEEADWNSLTDDEKDCYHHFLLEIKPDDYLVYINQPEWGQCTLAKVAAPYEFRFEDKDFNHRFRVDKGSVRWFDRNDTIVHPHLSARLKLQTRWWRIYAEKEFLDLLEKLENAGEGRPRKSEDNLRLLRDEIEEPLRQVANRVQHTHPNFDLEDLLKVTLEAVPGVKRVERHRGRGDQGADLTADVEAIPGLLQKVVIQVKAYEGEIDDLSAVEDIERTLGSADMGLIVSTATTASKGFMDALDKLREKKGKPVALLHGAELAVFVLKHNRL